MGRRVGIWREGSEAVRWDGGRVVMLHLDQSDIVIVIIMRWFKAVAFVPHFEVAVMGN